MIFTEKVYGLPSEQLESLYGIEARLPRYVGESSFASSAMLKIEANQAIIEVDGVLFPKPNILTLLGFGTALADIRLAIERAAGIPAVKNIILNFSSPGGSITGINELANYIKGIDKPTVAYVGGMAASAAYWLASACDQIVVDETSLLGNIGVVALYRAKSEQEIEIVSSHAPYKRPDLKTDEGRRIVLNHIDALEAVFISSLTRLRPSLKQEAIKALGGDMRVGALAVQAGLADGLSSFQGVIEGKQAIKPKVSAVTHEGKPAALGLKNNVGRIYAARSQFAKGKKVSLREIPSRR